MVGLGKTTIAAAAHIMTGGVGLRPTRISEGERAGATAAAGGPAAAPMQPEDDEAPTATPLSHAQYGRRRLVVRGISRTSTAPTAAASSRCHKGRLEAAHELLVARHTSDVPSRARTFGSWRVICWPILAAVACAPRRCSRRVKSCGSCPGLWRPSVRRGRRALPLALAAAAVGDGVRGVFCCTSDRELGGERQYSAIRMITAPTTLTATTAAPPTTATAQATDTATTITTITRAMTVATAARPRVRTTTTTPTAPGTQESTATTAPVLRAPQAAITANTPRDAERRLLVVLAGRRPLFARHHRHRGPTYGVCLAAVLRRQKARCASDEFRDSSTRRVELRKASRRCCGDWTRTRTTAAQRRPERQDRACDRLPSLLPRGWRFQSCEKDICCAEDEDDCCENDVGAITGLFFQLLALVICCIGAAAWASPGAENEAKQMLAPTTTTMKRTQPTKKQARHKEDVLRGTRRYGILATPLELRRRARPLCMPGLAQRQAGTGAIPSSSTTPEHQDMINRRRVSPRVTGERRRPTQTLTLSWGDLWRARRRHRPTRGRQEDDQRGE